MSQGRRGNTQHTSMSCLNGLAFSVENPQGHFQLSFTTPPLYFSLYLMISQKKLIIITVIIQGDHLLISAGLVCCCRFVVLNKLPMWAIK